MCSTSNNTSTSMLVIVERDGPNVRSSRGRMPTTRTDTLAKPYRNWWTTNTNNSPPEYFHKGKFLLLFKINYVDLIQIKWLTQQFHNFWGGLVVQWARSISYNIRTIKYVQIKSDSGLLTANGWKLDRFLNTHQIASVSVHRFYYFQKIPGQFLR